MSSVVTVAPASREQPQLVDHAACCVRRAEVGPRARRRRRQSEPVGVAQHRLDRDRSAGERALRLERLEDRQWTAGAQLRQLLERPLAPQHRPAAQPPLEEVHVGAAEPTVRRPEKREEVSPCSVTPGEPEQRQQRLAEGGRAEPHAPLDRERHAERAERRLDRGSRRVRATGRRPRCPPGRSPRGRDRGSSRRATRAWHAVRPPRGSGSTRREERERCRPRRGGARDGQSNREGTACEPAGSSTISPAGQRAQVVGRPLQRCEHGAARLVRAARRAPLRERRAPRGGATRHP